MDVKIYPHTLSGNLSAIASKSVAHRALICAAFADGPTDIICKTTNKDIQATIDCLVAYGARITVTDAGFRVQPISRAEACDNIPILDAGESGSTLRFLLPCVAAFGKPASFVGHGRLPQRPLAPLDRELSEHSVNLTHPKDSYLPLKVSGKLDAQELTLPGDISSQYISGLLLAAAVKKTTICVHVKKPVESLSYIRITTDVLQSFGLRVRESEHEDELLFAIDARSGLKSPGSIQIEGDWSNAAFWLVAGAIAGTCTLSGLSITSKQGDKKILSVLEDLGADLSISDKNITTQTSKLSGIELNVQDIPDLVPPFALACTQANTKSHIFGAARLRLKESDRLESITSALTAMGADIQITKDGLNISPKALYGGVVDAVNDHRIAMMAAVGACIAKGPTIIQGAECVQKSYPAFFEDLKSLGAQLEFLDERS